MSDKLEVSVASDSNLPELVTGARVVSASPLDDFIHEIFGEPKALDAGADSAHIKPE